MKTKLLLLLPMVMLATACSEEHSDLQAWMQETQQAAKSKLKPPEAPEEVARVTYHDPERIVPNAFDIRRMRPDVDRPVNTANLPNLNRPKELLENYALNQLKFVGTIGSGNALSALIEAEGQVYTVKLGNYLGQNYGRVVKITPDEITLSETIEDSKEGWVKRQMLMVLGQVGEADEAKKP